MEIKTKRLYKAIQTLKQENRSTGPKALYHISGLTYGSIFFHLDKLVKEGFIKMDKTKTTTIELTDKKVFDLPVLSHRVKEIFKKKQKSYKDYLKEAVKRGDLDPTDISHSLDLKRNGRNHYLKGTFNGFN